MCLDEYELQPPGSPAFHSHVAEVFKVRDEKIVSLDIYFDSTPFLSPSWSLAIHSTPQLRPNHVFNDREYVSSNWRAPVGADEVSEA
jgi:hypothetical protein